jgi:predicted extracellular nuclease
MRIAFFYVLLLICLPIFSQKSESIFTLVFYNTENLFDTIDSRDTDDIEFTPGSLKKWNTQKYLKKVNDLGKVLSSINENELPEIIGLAEIENIKVLQDLLNTQYLRKVNYGIAHKDSLDKRGIDVALLYRKDEFKFSGNDFIHVPFPFDSTLKTRDILHVYGKLSDGSDMHFYVNHWSSRDGGQRETEVRRMYCAVALRRNIDMVLSKDSNARIVIMGDFNDEPTNKSLMSVLQSANKRKNLSVGEFYNLMYDAHNLTQTGSYYYQGIWNMFDQIIVSQNLITAVEGYRCNYESGKVFRKEWMMFTNNSGVSEPNPTYGGNEYFGGISNHLPVYMLLTK